MKIYFDARPYLHGSTTIGSETNIRKNISNGLPFPLYFKINLKLFQTSVQTSQKILKKISEKYIIQDRRYPYIAKFQ